MLFMLGMISIGVLGFIATFCLGALILYSYAFVITWLPRQMYWIRAPFIALIMFMAGGWLIPVAASMIHPKGPLISTVMIFVVMIGGDSFHYWRKKRLPPEEEEIVYQERERWE